MKKKHLLIIGLSLSVLLPAQTPVPNSGFENWSLVGNIELPDNWYIRQYYNPEDGISYGYSKTLDKYTGNYALRIYNSMGTRVGDTIFGMISTLSPNHQEGIKPSFPVTIRHTKLNGYYKYSPANGDSCQFIVWMYNHGYKNSKTQNVLGGGWVTKSATSTYIPFTFDISYYDNDNIIPDSACISLSAFRMYDFSTFKMIHPKGNSELYVDNISFDGYISEINTIRNSVKDVSIYPNPASSTVIIEALFAESNYQMNLYDLNGNVVKSIVSGKLSGQRQIAVNVEGIPANSYLLIITTNDGYISKKLVVKR